MKHKLTLAILGVGFTVFSSCLMYADVGAGVSVYSASSPQTSKNQTQQAGNPDVKVWVNTRSGVYHCPGTKWYGATKNGEFMSQKQAQEKRFRPAYGKVCQ